MTTIRRVGEIKYDNIVIRGAISLYTEMYCKGISFTLSCAHKLLFFSYQDL